MTMPQQPLDVPLDQISTHPKVENAITNVLKRVPKKDLPRMEAVARQRGFSSFEAFLRSEAVTKIGPQIQAEIAQKATQAASTMGAVQPSNFTLGGPLAGAAPSPLPTQRPVAGMLPQTTDAGRRLAAQKLDASMAGTVGRGTRVMPTLSPSSAAQAASLADDAALMGRLGSAQPGAYSMGGPLSLLNKTPGWNNGLPPAPGAVPALPVAPLGPTVPSTATSAAQRLSASAAGTAGSSPIAAPAAPAMSPGGLPASAPLTGRIAGPAASGGRIAGALGLKSGGGAGLLGGPATTKLITGRAIQAGTGLMLGGTAASLVDKANVGGGNSILDQFTTGAVGGGVAGGIAGAGTGPGAALTAGAGALIGGVGNVLGNQLGLWGAKSNPSASGDAMDLAVSKLMVAADNAGLNNTQELAQALRAQSDLYSGKGGKAKLNTLVDGLISKLPDYVMSQSAERERMAYDSRYRAEALANMQPRIDAMKMQYNRLADLYEQRGDPQFAQGLRANAEQQAAALVSQIQQIPQQYALEKARNFAAQLEQARMSQQIGQLVNPSTSGGLEALATG